MTPVPSNVRVAVASRSFSNHPVLREELLARYPAAVFNTGGRSMRGEELVTFLSGCERAVVALEKVDDALLEKLPNLKVIAKYGVGLDNIDLGALHRRGVLLGWQGGVNRRSAAEHALFLMLGLLRRGFEAHLLVRSGGWAQLSGSELSGKTVGIVGLGHVGRELAMLLRGFGCHVIANDIADVSEPARHLGVELTDLDSLLARSRVVSLHVPRDSSTENLIDARRLALMRVDAILVNAARGGVVDEQALFEALTAGRPAAAGLDVFDVEPPEQSPLLSLPNVVATPHIGGSSGEAILAMGRSAIAMLDAAKPALPENFGLKPYSAA